MAGGIGVFPQSRTASHLLRTSICTVSSLRKCTSYPPTASNYLRFSPYYCTRLLCSCSNRQNDAAIGMSKYRESFSMRMAMAGLLPHHRIAMGVSGGPDSMALCVLAADWKMSGLYDASKGCNDVIDGLLAIVVDHGLRVESKDEAKIVQNRVSKMDVRLHNVNGWMVGRKWVIFKKPLGAELFILRLSRNSGVLGLAGMASSSQLFSTFPKPTIGASSGILLVRPLLEFSKDDMYKICQGGNQQWVEDPTNRKPIFARNRIRMSLENLSTSTFKSELQAVISACRKTRLYVDKICHKLISQAVTIMPQGYIIIDLGILSPSNIQNICLSKFLSLLLQFISQRHRPVRGSALKLLLDYIRTSPCKSSLTAAGCYLCAAPGSKGNAVLICCAVDSALPSKMELLYTYPFEEHKHAIRSEMEQIIARGKSYSDQMVPDASDVHFLDVASSDSILTEAQLLNILSESTLGSILTLQGVEMQNFKPRTEMVTGRHSRNVVESRSTTKGLLHGQIGYFMNRFLVTWKMSNRKDDANYCCTFCLVDRDMILQVRHMVDADWLYLAKLSKFQNLERFQLQSQTLDEQADEMKAKSNVCSVYANASARTALLLLKSIPVAARRSLPVLVNPEGKLLSIPSVSFNCCPCLEVSAEFNPGVPIGGGHSSYI